MYSLAQILSENEDYIDYDFLQKNKEISTYLYSLFHIEHEQTPMDYIDAIWLYDDHSCGISLFIEPVGNISFKGTTCDELFNELNRLFNSQPEDMDYANAGHQLYYYARHIRKGRGIDFRYIDYDMLWSADFNEQEAKQLSFSEIHSGNDLFQYINQKNRVPLIITDEIYFSTDGIVSMMIGEMILAEPYMPDLFKVVIDLTKFDVHNRHMLAKSGYADAYKAKYPRNNLYTCYFSYEDIFAGFDWFILMESEQIPQMMKEAHAYYDSGFDGDYAEYKELRGK